MAARLSKVKVGEVSLVDRGANQHAGVVISKRDGEVTKNADCPPGMRRKKRKGMYGGMQKSMTDLLTAMSTHRTTVAKQGGGEFDIATIETAIAEGIADLQKSVFLETDISKSDRNTLSDGIYTLQDALLATFDPDADGDPFANAAHEAGAFAKWAEEVLADDKPEPLTKQDGDDTTTTQETDMDFEAEMKKRDDAAAIELKKRDDEIALLKTANDDFKKRLDAAEDERATATCLAKAKEVVGELPAALVEPLAKALKGGNSNEINDAYGAVLAAERARKTATANVFGTIGKTAGDADPASERAGSLRKAIDKQAKPAQRAA